LPELMLDAGGGAQVFPEPLQSDETFEDGRPRTTLTRRFSIVPSRAGTLSVNAPRIEWWDVRGAVPRTATLPPIALAVAPGAAGTAPAIGATAASATTAPQGEDGRIRIPGIQGRILPWAALAAMFAVLMGVAAVEGFWPGGASSGMALAFLALCAIGVPALMAHLDATIADKIAIANPKWR